MGRTLQKKKNRSSISKVKHKPKSQKRMLHHPIIAANWDKTLTFAQNYARLGLTAKLNKSTGGVERKVSDVRRDEEEGGGGGESRGKVDPLNITAATKRKERLDVSEVRIERDPETGAILRVVDDEVGRKKRSNPLNDPLNELDTSEEEEEDDAEEDDDVLNLNNQHGSTDLASSSRRSANKTETVRQLEEEANRPVTKYKRRQPEGEVAFIEELVRKHGDDYEKMARDHKVNYMQRSEGDLKKRIKKWRQSGGTV